MMQAKVSSECDDRYSEAGMEELAQEVARQARQEAAAEEEAAISAKEEATFGTEQEEEEAVVGAEEAQAEMDKKARLDAKKARSDAIWKGKLRWAHPHYTGLHIDSRDKPLGEGHGTPGHAE